MQAAASSEEKITEDKIYDVVSKAKPKDINEMITKALTGDFMKARDLLRESMVLQGTSGEDMVNQIYQDVSKRAMEGKMDSEIYIDLIEAIANSDFRIREGANPRIQLEALLTKFL
jgi:replication factor C small subunit